MYDCALKKKEIFVRKLSCNQHFISELEELLGKKNIKEELILEMLNIYYESE